MLRPVHNFLFSMALYSMRLVTTETSSMVIAMVYIHLHITFKYLALEFVRQTMIIFTQIVTFGLLLILQ